MKLATVIRADGTTGLYGVALSGSLFDVVEAAGGNRAALDGVHDVGSLYRAGPAAVDLVRKLGVDPQSSGLATTALDDVALAPPVTNPRAIVCIGRNYMAHIEEGGSPVPAFPLLFSKFANTLVGHKGAVVHHAITQQLDWEGELAVVIGYRAHHVSEGEAMEVVAGYIVANDISARDLQLGDPQWIRGKSLDTFCPLGPIFVSRDEIPDVDQLRLQTHVNGDLRQDAPISDMIFKIPKLIEFITEGLTLEPGDLILTGTPSGVAYGMSQPVYLKAGDVVDVSITNLGTLSSMITEPS